MRVALAMLPLVLVVAIGCKPSGSTTLGVSGVLPTLTASTKVGWNEVTTNEHGDPVTVSGYVLALWPYGADPSTATSLADLSGLQVSSGVGIGPLLDGQPTGAYQLNVRAYIDTTAGGWSEPLPFRYKPRRGR